MFFYKALSGNMIDEIKFCLSINDVFKLFEIVVLANIHYKYSQKPKKKFFVFEEKDYGMMSFMAPCIIYFNVMGFM